MHFESALKRKFILLETCYWAFYASFLSYATTLLRARGVSGTGISLMVVGYMLFAVIGSFVWGAVCDALGGNRKVILPAMGVTAALMLLFYRFAGGNTALTCVAYLGMGLVTQPIAINIDAWLIRACGQSASAYGRIRSTGSLAYALTTLVMGQLMGRLGYLLMPVCGLSFLCVTAAVAFLTPDDSASHGTVRTRRFGGGELRDMLHLKPYLFLLGVLFFNALATAPANSLKIVLMENVGGGVSHIGVDQFIGVMLQVPLIALAGRIQKIPLKLRYILITLAPMAMLTLCYLAKTPAMIILGTCFTNISVGLAVPTMREVTNDTVPERLRNLGHNLSDAIYNSFAGMIALMYAGAVADAYGVRAMLTICIIVQVLPIAMSVWNAARRRR